MSALRRRLLKLAIMLLAGLLLLWLALPRLLGFALSHWLEIPGVSGLSVQFETVSWQRIQLAALKFRYQTATGDSADVTANDVVLEIDAARRHAKQIRIGELKLLLAKGESAPPEPWPILQLPRLPFDDVQIANLHIHAPQYDIESPQPLRLQLQQTDDRTLTLKAEQADLQLHGELSETAEQLQLNLTAQAAQHTALELRLISAHTPTLQPVQLQATLQLASLPPWQRVLPQLAPLANSQGKLMLDNRITLGNQTGHWQQLDGQLTLQSLQLQTELAQLKVEGEAQLIATANTNVDDNANINSTTMLPERVLLRWLPHTQLQWQMRDSALGKGQIALTDSYTLQWQTDADSALPGQLSSTDTLPLQWQAEKWGSWQFGLRDLIINQTAAQGWLGQLMLQLQGSVPSIQQPPVRATQLQMQGLVAVQLSDTASPQLTLLAEQPLKIRANTITLDGDTPWQLNTPELNGRGKFTLNEGRDGWQLADASMQLDGAMLNATQTEQRLNLQRWQAQVQRRDQNWQGTATVRQLRWQQTQQQLQVEPLTITLEQLTADGDAVLGINADALQHSELNGWPRPALTMRLNKRSDTLRFSGKLAQQQTELARFTGQHQLTNERGSAAVQWQHELLALDRLLQPRPRALTALSRLLGNDQGELTVNWHLAATEPVNAHGTLQVHNAALQWDQAKAEQIQFHAQLQNLLPLQGSLHLQVPSAQLGAGIPVQRTQLQLQLDAEQLQLQTLHSELLGGIWQAAAQQLPRTPSEQALPIQISGLDLAQVLALVDVDGLSGSGQLDGSLPFVYQADGIAIRAGELVSRAPGVLKYAPETVVGDNPGLQALRDFRYQQMRVSVDYQPNGNYHIRLKLDGHNPSFYSGYPIAFTLNLKGELPGLFRAAILSGDFNQHVLQQLQSGQLQ